MARHATPRDAARPVRRHGRHVRVRRRHSVGIVLSAAVLVAFAALPGLGRMVAGLERVSHDPPPPEGWFRTAPVGAWERLPGDTSCAEQVHRSTWEPRPDNNKANHTVPDPDRVRAALATRPRSGPEGGYDPRFDSRLLERVSGQHTGTTDENIQWAACKWGLPDNLLRAIAVRESTWYQGATYPNGRCVEMLGCGDMVEEPNGDTRVFCAAIGRFGHDYEADYGTGVCPKTFSIVGVMAWEDPRWGVMDGNQNGTFPFSRDSTAYALDYLGAYLRGCYEGWVRWLDQTGDRTYAAGDLAGCVGSWYAGEWRSPAALHYIELVEGEVAKHTWLTEEFARHDPPCSKRYGCP